MENKLNRIDRQESGEVRPWLGLLDEIADMLGVTLLAYDAKEYLLRTCRPSAICHGIQETEEGTRLCEKDCGSMLSHVAHGGEMRTFKCHAGLYNFAAPFYRDGRVNIVLLGGRVFQTYQDFSRFSKMASTYSLKEYEFVDWENALKYENAGYFERVVHLMQRILDAIWSNSPLEEKIRKRSFQLETLYELSSSLSIEGSVEKGCQLILQAISVLFDIKDCAVFRMAAEEEPLRPVASLGSSARSDAIIAGKGSEMIAALQKGQAHRIDETYQVLKMGYPESIRCIHSFPINSKGELAWILQIFNTTLDPDVVQSLMAFCRHTGVSLENLQLKQDLKNQAAVLTVVDGFTSAVRRDADSPELFRNLLSRIAELLGADKGSLMVYDPSSNELAVKSVRGLNEKIIERLRIKPGEGISGSVFETGRSLLVRDVGNEPRFQSYHRARYKTPSFISVPLTLHQQRLGVINVADKSNGEAFETSDLKLLEAMASHASVALERAEYQQKSQDLMKISITDSLTELFNRRYFQDRLTEEIERAKRHGQPLTFIMLDIDNFKSYNDSYGHLAGDEALRMTATLLKGSVRNIDIVARYGGEEFAVILPMTEIKAAKDIAERVRSSVASQYYPDESLQLVVKATVSLGIASFPQDADNLLELVGNADKALYLAKISGKNRVAIFDKARRMSSASGR